MIGISNITSMEEDKLQRCYRVEKSLISLVVDSAKNLKDLLSPIYKRYHLSSSIL